MSLQIESIGLFQCASTSSNSVTGLTMSCNGLGRKITLVSPEMITQWINEYNSLFILPGGVCSGWDKVLPDDFQENLSKWVIKGNNLFATCAGAYYCSKQTIFSYKNNEPLEKTRNVQLYPGKCIGPLYENLKIVKIRWHNDKIGYVVLLWGGFFETEVKDNLKTLGSFECKKSNKPAVIQSKVGNGLAILSSVHWEWNSKDVIQCNPNIDTSKMARKLDDSFEFRQECFREIMQELNKITL